MNDPSSSPRRRTNWSRSLVIGSGFVLAAVIARNAWQAYDYFESIQAIRCDHPVFDFPVAFSGDVLHHTFHVTNVGRRPIEISNVRAQCGCTTIADDLKGRVVQPQGSFDVPVQLSLSAAEQGELEKRVMVQFSGKPARKLVLKLQGPVRPRWTWSPEVVIFDDVPADRPTQRKIRVTRHPQAPPADIIRVNTSHFLSASVERDASDSDGRSWILTVNTVPALPPGRRQGMLFVETSDGTSTTQGPRIPVTLIVPRSDSAEQASVGRPPAARADSN